MGIRFYCPNGHKLNVKSFQAGRRGICPHCGAKVQIPTESTRPGSKGLEGDAQQIETVAQSAPNGPGGFGAQAPAPAGPQANVTPGAQSTPAPTSQPTGFGTQATASAGGPAPHPGFGQASFGAPNYGASPNPSPAGGTPSAMPGSGQPYNQASTAGPSASGGGFPTFGHASTPSGAASGGVGGDYPLASGGAFGAANDPALAGAAGMQAAGWGAAPSAAAMGAPTSGPPDPLAEDPNAVWYVRLANGGQYGPAGADVMRSWLDEGRVAPDALVWREGWRDWQEASSVFPQLGAGQDDTALAGIGATPGEPPGRTGRSRVRSRRRNDNLRAALIVVLLLAVIVLFGVFIWVLNQDSAPPVEGESEPPAASSPAAEMNVDEPAPSEPPADDML